MFANIVRSQESILFDNSFTENTSDRDKFSMYLDAIRKYRYADFDFVSQVIPFKH